MPPNDAPEGQMGLLAGERAGDNAGALSVSEISAALKRHVEQGFSHVRIRGEVSGFKRAASGHLYFALKDEHAVMDALMWKGSALRLAFQPQDGVEVIASGKLTTFPGRSKYQIIVESMEIAGEGALLALLERLKARLATEGLFAPERKRRLPFLPRTIGVVTSPTGAVIRDILHRLADRCPTRVIVWPVLVQGHGSAEQVAAAVNGFSAMQGADRPDLIIVARGGGSIEDLWGFNEEIVVRAVATPTAAAEMAVPVRAELLAGLQTLGGRSLRCVQRYRDRAGERLEATARRLPTPDTLLGPHSQRVDDLGDRLRRGLSLVVADARGDLARASGALRPAILTQKIDHARARLDQLWRVATSLNPDRVLERGYARIERTIGGTITSAAQAKAAGAVRLHFSDGAVDARVEQGPRGPYDRPKPEQPDLF